MSGTLASLATAVTTVRLSLHVLGAAVWVGGQIVLGGLVPVLRRLGPDAPKQVARAFARIQWPAYVLLLGTGIWNVVAVGTGQSPAWHVVLDVKIAIVVVAGLAAYAHQRSKTSSGLAVWGAVSGISTLAALVLGVLLAG